MDFKLTAENEADQQAFRAFAENVLAKYFHEMEEQGCIHAEVLDGMKREGFMGIPIAKEYGGAGKDFLTATLLMEEFSKYNGAVPGLINVHTEIVTLAITKYGTDEQKSKYLSLLAKGDRIGGFALTEPGAGSDASAVRTVAEEEGDAFVLNGTKCFITSAEQADIFLVAAKTLMDDGKKKISMFIVEKGMEGFSLGKHEDKMGFRASSTCELILDNVRVPKNNLLGTKGKGLAIALAGLDGGRVQIAAQGLGIAQGCFDETVEYLKTHAEETDFAITRQAVQFELARIQTSIDAARLLVYRAADFWDKKLDFGKEAAMAKFYATDTANDAIRRLIRLRGEEGTVYGKRAEQFFRDAKLTEIYEGTNEIQLMVIAGKMGWKA